MNSSGLPIFEQIENAIKKAIFFNELKEGEIIILRKGNIALKIVKDGNFKIRGELWVEKL